MVDRHVREIRKLYELLVSLNLQIRYLVLVLIRSVVSPGLNKSVDLVNWAICLDWKTIRNR